MTASTIEIQVPDAIGSQIQSVLAQHPQQSLDELMLQALDTYLENPTEGPTTSVEVQIPNALIPRIQRKLDAEPHLSIDELCVRAIATYLSPPMGDPEDEAAPQVLIAREV